MLARSVGSGFIISEAGIKKHGISTSRARHRALMLVDWKVEQQMC